MISEWVCLWVNRFISGSITYLIHTPPSEAQGMCYHTYYIFLACGHSMSSLRPIRPSPPCPNQHQPLANGTAAAAPQRPFSFDPSVATSPLSPTPEPLSPQTPWRLERPFSTPESPSLAAYEDEVRTRAASGNTGNKKASSFATVVVDGPENEHKSKSNSAAGNGARQYTHCGRILTHPYHSYKIEGLCLHCQRRRNNLLASFEVNAIRETVYRESELRSVGEAQRKFRALSSHAEEKAEDRVEGDDSLKPMTLPVAVSMLGRNVHFQPGLAEVEQQQQQQTPWRLTLPPAEIPRTGWGLAGMRDGEWI